MQHFILQSMSLTGMAIQLKFWALSIGNTLQNFCLDISHFDGERKKSRKSEIRISMLFIKDMNSKPPTATQMH